MRNILELDKGAKGIHSCFSMATLNAFIFLTAKLSWTTIQMERIVVFEQQQSLSERVIILHQMNEYSFMYFVCHSGMSHPKHITQ